ncbi:MAG: glycosyl hydrolase 53 family protein [Bacteroidales bacterium]|nr:glycosyl hydrolase 53 family protein [Bacteroidales bacterium]
MKRNFILVMIAAALMTACLAFSCNEKPEPDPEPQSEDDMLYVGGDISMLQSYIDHSTKYYDEDGNLIQDVLGYMHSDAVGWNAQRVRIFVNPSQKNPDGGTDLQVCQDFEYVLNLCQEIKNAGFALMLDFHYSDTWADPANQWIPKEWESCNDDELCNKVFEHTREILIALSNIHCAPDFIQIGNEVTYGMLWSATVDRNSSTNRCYVEDFNQNWNRFINLLKSASKACREFCPQAKIIIHTERAGYPDVTELIYKNLSAVDYDIIGLSYYPFWHNSLNVLAQTLNMLATNFPDKKVQIVETAYYYQYQPKVGSGIDYDYSSRWPVSPEGQAAYAKDLITELKRHPNVNGLFWWFPEENGNGADNNVSSYWVNRGLWNNTTHRAQPALYVLQDFLKREE